MHPFLRRRATRLLAGLLLSSTIGLVQAKAQDAPTPPRPVSPYGPIGTEQDPLGSPASNALKPMGDEPPPPGVVALPPVVAATPEADCVPCVPFWTKVPPITPMPRPGWFIIPPSGPGYYSLLDLLRHNELPDRPKQPFGPYGICAFSFFDADFRYLDDPNNTQFDFFDPLKRMHPNDNWMLSLGGEFRYRLMDEVDSRLSGKNNFYNLLRERAYADIWYRDRVRAYVEFIGAQSYGWSLPPLAIDRNQADFLNLFVDVKVMEVACNPLTVRVGRQELLYGSQRLISPLDWANTRRTFQGVKGFWHGENWDLDMFWVKPVIVNAINLDNWDQNQNFWGSWATWKPKKGTTVDMYILNLNNANPVATGVGGLKGGYDITTFGSRTAGDYDGRFLWDFEGMVQTGIRANQEVVAGAYTVSAGYRAKDLPWTPTFWVGDDWASGNQNPGRAGATNSTFNQLFPFGHYYFGFLDLVGRQNINDFNVQLSLCPTRWLTTFVQFHEFSLVSPKDALYNAGGAVLRASPAGTAGRFVGDELDYVLNVHLTQHQDMLFGYSRLWSGEFIRNTGNPLSPYFLYAQYSFKW